MGLRRYAANADTTIFNSYNEGLSTRQTEANAGASDVLEVFSLYAHASTSSIELSRVLVQFPVDELFSDIQSGSVPSTGVRYFLKLFNVAHGETLPFNYDLEVRQISGSWTEGHGLTMPLESGTEYTGSGASWDYSANESAASWVSAGGDFTGSAKSVSFDVGDEDIELDITDFVEDWLEYEASGTNLQNFGLAVKFSDAVEVAPLSYYTKRFSARGSEYFFQRPVLEARFDKSVNDDRGNFYASSSLVSDIQNRIYFYNNPRGEFQAVPAEPLTVKFFTERATGSQIGTTVTASSDETGKYYIDATVDTDEEVIWDRWFDANEVCLTTSSINVQQMSPSTNSSVNEYVISIPKLKSVYRSTETARFDLLVRQKDWVPTLYVVANSEIENTIIEKAYFQVRRLVDDQIVIDFDDTYDSTLLSYDSSGNYFELDMSMLQENYMYELVFALKINGNLRTQEETFKFRVQK